MIRFIFRSLATLVFALACVFAVVDAARSVGAATFVFTPLGDTLAFLAPDITDTLTQMINNIHPILNDPVLATVFILPTWLVAGLIALLLYLFGYRPKSRRGRFIVS